MNAFQTIRQKVYFIPTLYGFLGFLLALLVILGDGRYAMTLSGMLPPFFTLGSDLTRSLFGALVGALLAMITVSFSTMMVVLTLYSGQFSPRITRDFLERKVSLRVLGLFMGSFIFSLFGLYASGGVQGDRFLLMPLTGLGLAIACLSAFGYFIFHVSKAVQINSIIEKITGDILRVVDKTIEKQKNDPQVQNRLEKKPERVDKEVFVEVPAGTWGFIGNIDEKTLLKLAVEADCLFHLKKRLGDFVQEEDVLARVYRYRPEPEDGGASDGEHTVPPDPEELTEKIQKAFSLGEERNTLQDAEFGIVKLVEIALRAISPGINDPNTAIYCISKLSPILRKIGTELEHRYYFDEQEVLRLHIHDVAFEPLLYNSYFQLRNYGRHDVSVLGAMIDSLIGILGEEGYQDAGPVWTMAEYLLEDVGCDSFPAMDIDYLNSRVQKLARLSGRDPQTLLLGKRQEGNCTAVQNV